MEKEDIDLAKVGLIALIDEATGYQYVRKPDELQCKLKDLRGKKQKEYELVSPIKRCRAVVDTSNDPRTVYLGSRH